MMDSENKHPHIQFDIQIQNLDADPSNLKRLIRGICETFDAGNAAIDISIVDDTQITELHRTFLKKDTTTDVISFDLTDETETTPTFQLAVNAQMAARQAEKRGHSTEAELALYITHGMLHNLGFDDCTEQMAEKMHQTEDTLLQQFGFGIIYNKDEIKH